MSKWFYDPEEQFYMWDIAHLITILVIIILISLLFIYRKPLFPYRKKIRITVGLSLIMSRISLDVWYMATGQWSTKSSLPLELCSIASIACAIMLLTKNRSLFEIFYFIALGGAMQAIITPDLHFPFPQYRFLQFFIDHFLLMIAPLIMIWLYSFTITLRSVIKSFFTLNIIALIVYGFNIALSANYMFLRYKPSAGSLLDFLGPYPYYILSLEIVTLCIFVVLYLPFSWHTVKLSKKKDFTKSN